MNFGVYIHIPFCAIKCSYCTFVIRPWREEIAERYHRALLRELRDFFLRKCEWNVADTIYFGGGTPSLVPPEYIEEVLSTCRQVFELSDACEISIEANPGTLTPRKLGSYRSCGVNRISLGVQSFDDESLAAVGRDHTAEQAASSLRLARGHGFDNVSFDLILGLPGQDGDEWDHNLGWVQELAPAHVSVYMMELDEKSPLYHQVARHRRTLPDDECISDWYLQSIEHLAGLGYDHYEISNFALRGYCCRHNLKYWCRMPVLGFGLGSHSFDGRVRYANFSRMGEYLRRVENGVAPVEWRKPVEDNEGLAEILFLGLRLDAGVDWDALSRKFGSVRLTRYEKSLQEMARAGLAEWRGASIRLTPRGMLISNEIFQEFV